MAIGENRGGDCRIDDRQTLQEAPRTTANEIDVVYNTTMGEKDILFGRGNSMCRRASNRHLLDFVDIFKDHYFASGPFERNQIVRRIVDMLKNDGYSFWKQQKRRYSSSRTIPAVIENSDDMDDAEADEISVPPQHKSLWTEMSPSEVQKRVAKFFQKPVQSTDCDWRKQHDHQHQQQVAAFHQAISTAIDVSSLNPIAALDDAISSAIDASSIARAIRDCPSPEFSLALSTSSSQSAFDPVVSLSDSQHENQLYLESLSLSPSPSPTMEQQIVTEKAPACDTKQPADRETPISCHRDGNQSETGSAEESSALPRDGILWSNGSQQIRLLGGMESSIVPVKSISLFSNAQQVAFEKKTEVSVASSRHTTNAREHLSKTIGYTQQIVGNLTILRPIVLLPE